MSPESVLEMPSPSSSRTESLPLHVVTGPHNGTREYQIEIQRFPPGGDLAFETQEGQVVVAKDEAGFRWAALNCWYYDFESDQWCERIGGQRLLIREALTYRRYTAPFGRRFGKTTSIPFLLLEEGAQTEKTYYAVCVSPSHDKAYELMEFVIAMWGGRPGKGTTTLIKRVVGGPKDQRRYIETHPLDIGGVRGPNEGARIYFISGAHQNIKRVRGYPHAVHRIIVDEFAQSHPEAWRVLSPMLGDARGSALFIGTTDINEVGNELFKTFYERGESDEKKYASWGCMNFPTYANPELNEEGIADIVADCITKDDIEQEIHARFLQGKGAVFKNLDNVITLPFLRRDELPDWVHDLASDAIKRGEGLKSTERSPPKVFLHKDYIERHQYLISADWAKGNDYSTIGVYDMTDMEMALGIEFAGTNYIEQLVWVQGVTARYKCLEFHGDENTGAGQSMHELLRKEFKTCVAYDHGFTPYNKHSYVRRGEIAFWRADMKLIDFRNLRKQFAAYRRILPKTDSGEKRVKFGHPPGGNDDWVDNFLMITEAVQDGRRPEREPPLEHQHLYKDGQIKIGVLMKTLRQHELDKPYGTY